MRKIILVFVLFLLLITPRGVSAQGTYECVPVGRGAACHPNPNTDTCESGYEPDTDACAQYNGNPDLCRRAGGGCVATAQPEEQTQEEAQSDSGPLGAGDCDESEIETAIGCIPIENTNEFVSFILRWAIGIGGGISFLLIVYAAFMIMTSQGNPERLKAGQELLTSAIAGLILLIFSIFILRVIGVDILNLPGFGG